ncbi:unnamed protein product [Ambrosiozyma monospora]|uniref:Unnamed protein product n=1 Tax=Ambrosiozyma monospora TaxID=43982 RepID=A0ACB5SWR5_AMBMO|nr:unnamed protein product [Ambrosiozyma monospora]
MEDLVELYLKEICDGYEIDLYGEKAKAQAEAAEKENDDDDKKDNGSGGGSKLAVPAEVPETVVVKKSDDIDDLKKRFDALKRL